GSPVGQGSAVGRASPLTRAEGQGRVSGTHHTFRSRLVKEGPLRLFALTVKRKRWEPWAFASPSLALIALVIIFPLAYSFWLSLNNFDLSVGAEYEFVGAKNYQEVLFRDPRFMGSVWNTAVIIAPSLVLELILGLGLALLLSRVARGRPIITALLAIPPMIWPVMAAMAWRMMFGVKYGAINNLGLQLGLIDIYFDWFATRFLSILAVVLVDVWHNTSFMMLVLLAGLQPIPQELYDAAKADGASACKSFWWITLPLLKFTIAVAVVIRMIDLTKLFGLIFVLGPFFWIVTTSLKGNEDYFSFPPAWIPSSPSLAHYGRLFTRSSALRYFGNSIMVSTLSMLAALVVSLPTAYSFAWWRFCSVLFS